MTLVAWMLALLIGAGAGYAAWRARAQWQERKRASQARMASFVAQIAPALPPAAPAAAAAASVPPVVEERLLFEAAAKTAQAGEPVLAIQLYARLLSRYPQSPLAAQARAAVAEQKRKLA